MPATWQNLTKGEKTAVIVSALALVAALQVWLMLAAARAPIAEGPIAAELMRKTIGHAYKVRLDDLTSFPYSLAAAHPGDSSKRGLQLFQDGEPLGPPDALHQAIRETGGGAYFYWEGKLHFSTKGNVDPRDPNIRLTVIAPTVVNPTLQGAVWIVTILATLLCIKLAAPARSSWWERHAARVAWASSLGLSALLIGLYAAYWAASSRLVVLTPDIWGYLRPALVAAQGGDLVPTHARSFGYPLFLASIFEAGGGLLAVVVVQIGLVIGTAILGMAALLLMSRSGEARRGFYALFPLLFVGTLLSYQPITNLAHSIMPESLYIFLSVLCLLILLAAIQEKIGAWSLATLYVCGAFVSTYNFYVKPQWGAALLFSLGVLTLSLWLRKHVSLWLKLLLPVGTAVGVYLTIVSPQQQLFDRYEPEARLFGPMSFFCNHAEIVAPIVPKLGLDAGAAEELAARLNDTVERGPRGWPLRGLNGDYCFYRIGVPGLISSHFNGQVDAQAEFLMKAILAAIAAEPLHYVGSVAEQVLHALSNPLQHPGVTWPHDASLAHALAGYPGFDAVMLDSHYFVGREPRPLADNLPVLGWFFEGLLDLLNTAALPLWGLILLFRVVDGWLNYRDSTRRTAFLRRSLYIGTTAGLYLSATMVVAIVHSFDIARYLDALAPLALFALLTGISGSLQVLTERRWFLAAYRSLAAFGKWLKSKAFAAVARRGRPSMVELSRPAVDPRSGSVDMQSSSPISR